MTSSKAGQRVTRTSAQLLCVGLVMLIGADGARAEGNNETARNEHSAALGAGPSSAPRMAPSPPEPKSPSAPPGSSHSDPAMANPGPKPPPIDFDEPTKSAQELANEEFVQDAKEFQGESRSFQDDVKRVIQRKLAEKQDEVTRFYDEQIKSAEKAEREERIGAIALFERFLASYPNDENFTPDAMTRLAELYYEQEKDDADQRMADYQARVRMGVTDEPPPEEAKQFQKSIALYEQVLTKFPNYRLNDAVTYLLGWSLNEHGDAEAARDMFKQLTDKYPNSKYVPEAWVRIGEYYFDYSGSENKEAMLAKALEAYTKALQYKDSAFYDKALYKLGWAYFRINQFDSAVKTFLDLVDYYDSKKDADGGGDLRAEAIQYTAVSFGDLTWGGVDKLEAYLNSRGPHPYDSEIFRRLGDYHYNTANFDDAVLAYRKALQRSPTDPTAPQIASLIIKSMNQAYATDPAHHELEKVLEEGDAMAKLFGQGTPWYIANKDDQTVLQAGRDFIERMSLNNAQFWFQRAAQFQATAEDPGKPDDVREDAKAKALSYFKKAAESYESYLREFPRSKNVYSIQFNYAYALYSSGQFLRAADVFTQVRDSNADNTHFTDAAYYVVASLQHEIAEEEKSGQLQHVDPCIPVEICKAITDFSPRPIPDIKLRLISAADTYMKRAPKAEDAPQLSYIAGLTFYTYFHFDEARKRYFDVVKLFPNTKFYDDANDDILYSYLLQKKWLEIEQFVADQLKNNPGVKKDPKKQVYLSNILYSAMFNRALSLQEDGTKAKDQKKLQEAADVYERIVRQSDGKWDKCAEALYNEALCDQELFKFDSAMRLFEELAHQYPDSKLAEGALFKVAENAEKAFNYEKAISEYHLLVDRYKDSDDENAQKDRKAAQLNLAGLLEALQRYPESAREFQRYAEMFPDDDQGPDAVYEAVNIYGRMHDNKGLVGGLRNFIGKFHTKPQQADKIVEAYRKIAKALKEENDISGYKENLQTCVREFDRLGLKGGDLDTWRASKAASECAFELVEFEYADFAKRRFEVKARNKDKFAEEFKKEKESLATDVATLLNHYGEVITKYGWPEMMIAAMFRIGDVQEQLVNKLLDAPCPPMLAALDAKDPTQSGFACGKFKEGISDYVQPVMARSADDYLKAQKKAQELHIVNDWSKLAIERVCVNTPRECLSLKDPREEFIRDVKSPLGLVTDVDGTKPLEAAEAPPPPVVTPKPATPAAAPATGIGAPGNIPIPPATTPGTTQPAIAVPPAAAPGTVVIPLPAGTAPAPAGAAAPAPAAVPAVPAAVPAGPAPVAAPAGNTAAPTTVVLPPSTGGTP